MTLQRAEQDTVMHILMVPYQPHALVKETYSNCIPVKSSEGL
jgi:hypothetical protein